MEDNSSHKYLTELLNDKNQMQAVPNVFRHLERLLDEEIHTVRGNLFNIATNKEPLDLPEASGPKVTLSEKLHVPTEEHPGFNFVGRILGPRGMTTQQLERETGCKIMVRGKGSMRDREKEENNRGKPEWEHLNEDLHVLIKVEDCKERAEVKLQRAVSEVKKLLVLDDEGNELKKRQLLELSILNGTYRDVTKPGVGQITSPNALAIPAGQTPYPAAFSHYPPMAGALTFPGAAGMVGVRPSVPQGAPIFHTTPWLQQANPHVPQPRVSLPSQMHAGESSLLGVPPPLVPLTHGTVYSHHPYARTARSPMLQNPGPEQGGAATSAPSPSVHRPLRPTSPSTPLR